MLQAYHDGAPRTITNTALEVTLEQRNWHIMFQSTDREQFHKVVKLDSEVLGERKPRGCEAADGTGARVTADATCVGKIAPCVHLVGPIALLEELNRIYKYMQLCNDYLFLDLTRLPVTGRSVLLASVAFGSFDQDQSSRCCPFNFEP